MPNPTSPMRARPAPPEVARQVPKQPRRAPKSGRPSKILDAKVVEQVISYIRAGAYDWVAAQAAGLDRHTFRNWMRRGEQGEQPFLAFFARVGRARAEARIVREIKVAEKDPLAWLRLGPGRERPGEPGWTDSHALTGPEGGPVVTATASEAEIMERFDRMAAQFEARKAAKER